MIAPIAVAPMTAAPRAAAAAAPGSSFSSGLIWKCSAPCTTNCKAVQPCTGFFGTRPTTSAVGLIRPM